MTKPTPEKAAPERGSVLNVKTVPSGGATFTNTQTVARLLGGCPAAGFAAELYVDSLATDGAGSELGYDARALIAFALTPEA
jgi:hypothetical protein